VTKVRTYTRFERVANNERRASGIPCFAKRGPFELLVGGKSTVQLRTGFGNLQAMLEIRSMASEYVKGQFGNGAAIYIRRGM
jgi:hypothetical protein